MDFVKRVGRFMSERAAFTAVIALAAGMTIGSAASASNSVLAVRVISWVEPIGTLWVNAIRMTVIPLVVASLISAVAGDVNTSFARLGIRSLGLFIAMLSVAAAVTVLVAPPAFRFLADRQPRAPVPVSVEAAQRPPAMPSFRAWLTELIPANPFKAAVDGAILPLVIFTLMFAFALRGLAPDARRPLLGICRGISEGMVILVRAILVLTPVGVLALSSSIATKTGWRVMGAVGAYLVTFIGLLVLITVVLYPFATYFGKVPLRTFARAALPAQVVAMTTRSSMAALPVMVTSAEETLRVRPDIAAFVLPLSVATFRLNQPVSWPVMALFAAEVYNVKLAPVQVLTLATISVLMSFSIPGIPSAGLFVVAPIFAAVNIPPESIGLLLALDIIPDMFKTLMNVTAHLSVVTIVSRDGRMAQLSATAQEELRENMLQGE